MMAAMAPACTSCFGPILYFLLWSHLILNFRAGGPGIFVFSASLCTNGIGTASPTSLAGASTQRPHNDTLAAEGPKQRNCKKLNSWVTWGPTAGSLQSPAIRFGTIEALTDWGPTAGGLQWEPTFSGHKTWDDRSTHSLTGGLQMGPTVSRYQIRND